MSVVVLGSINMDIVLQVSQYPRLGETVFGNSMKWYGGGKGANQAAACARLHTSTRLLGMVGEDLFGKQLTEQLAQNGVDVTAVSTHTDEATGLAMITLDEQRENTIIVCKGANDRLTIDYIDQHRDVIINSDILLVQLEIPVEVAIYAMKLAHENGVKIVLDPAPAEGFQPEVMKYANLVVPNQQEAEYITGIRVCDEESARNAAIIMHQTYDMSTSIMKCGSKGVLLYESGQDQWITGISVPVVDTVGAGDAFAGALVSALDKGMSLLESVRFANVVGALKVTKHGAQAGLPTWQEAQNLYESYYHNGN